MTIHVYISISSRTGVERSFLKHHNILSDILDYTQQFVREVLAKDIAGLLCPLDFPLTILPSVARIPLFKKGESRTTELAAISEANLATTGWLIILRPLQGWVESLRFKSFIKNLQNSCSSTITSVVPLSSMGNPFWNCRFAPLIYEQKNSFLLPSAAEESVYNIDDTMLNKKFTQDTPPSRSQDLMTLYRNDSALFAIQTKELPSVEKSLLSSPTILYYNKIDAEKPWYFKLPIHELHEQSEIDLSDIDSYLISTSKKHS